LLLLAGRAGNIDRLLQQRPEFQCGQCDVVSVRRKLNTDWCCQAAINEMRTGVFGGGAGDRLHVPDVGILVSDAYSTVNANRTLPEATLAKDAGIIMLGVIVNPDHNLDDMTAIVTDPGTDLFFLVDPSNFDSVVAQVVDRLLEIEI